MAKGPRADEKTAGRARRADRDAFGHGRWEPAPGRGDPIGVLAAQNRDRIASLVPVRWGRMLESPFAFLRGAAAVMAADLATTSVPGSRSRPVATPTWPTSASSPLPNGSCCST